MERACRRRRRCQKKATAGRYSDRRIRGGRAAGRRAVGSAARPRSADVARCSMREGGYAAGPGEQARAGGGVPGGRRWRPVGCHRRPRRPRRPGCGQRPGGYRQRGPGRGPGHPVGPAGRRLRRHRARRPGLLRHGQRPGRRRRPQDRADLQGRRHRQPTQRPPGPERSSSRTTSSPWSGWPRRSSPGPASWPPRARPTFGYATQRLEHRRRTCSGPTGRSSTSTTTEPVVAYVAKQLGAKSVAVDRLQRARSRDACKAGWTGLNSYGVHVGYSDLSRQLRQRPQRRRPAHEGGRTSTSSSAAWTDRQPGPRPGPAAERPDRGATSLAQRLRPRRADRSTRP